MNTRHIPIIIVLIFICNPILYSLGEGETADIRYGKHLPDDTAGLTANQDCLVLPESFLRSYDPVTVFYSESRGPASGGPLDNPEGIISITPDHPGEYKWLDDHILQFLPAIPWPPLAEFEVSTGTCTHRIATLMIPPKHVSPSRRTDLEPFSEITLTFGERIEPRDLAEMITITIQQLPGLDEQETRWITGEDIRIKEFDREKRSSDSIYIVTLSSPVEYGKRAVLSLDLSLNPAIPGSVATYTFETKREFTIAGMGSGSVKYPIARNGSVYSLEQAINCGTRKNPLFIEFSEDLASPSVEEVKKLVKITPAVRNLTYNAYGKRIILYFDAERETPYQMALSHIPLESRSGRRLSSFGQSSMYFYYTSLSPSIRWLQASAIVERYGPQYHPMTGRAMEKIDLRIHKVSPLDLNFWPFPTNPVIIDESTPPRMPGEEPEYGTQIAEQIRLLGTPLISRVISLPIDKSTSNADFGIDVASMLAEISGPGAPGTYLLGYRELEGSSRRYYVKMTVTDLSLSTIEEEQGINFIVTSLKTGQPLSGADISIQSYEDKQWKTIIRGSTDREGRFYYSHMVEIPERIKRIVVSLDGDYLVLDPQNPPPEFMNNHWFGSSGNWLSWLNSKPVTIKEEAAKKGFILTERPIYRPEESVHVLGYKRVWKQGIIRIDRETGAQVIVSGPGGKSWDYKVTLNEYGYFSLLFDKQNIPTGTYTVYLMDTDSGSQLASTSFKKEAYRIPRFEINLSAPEKTPLDEVFTVTMTADYYSGGRVVDQQITWEVNRYGYQITSHDFPGYLFSSDERFTAVRAGGFLGSYSLEDLTDANGSATLTIDPSTENTSIPQRYVIHATVRGADIQTVTASTSVLALPPFVIGLKLEKLIREGLAVTPEILVIGHNEAPLAGKEIKVRLYHREWHSYLTETDITTGEAAYNSDIVDKLIFEKEYVSGEKPIRLSVPVTESGIYVAEVLGWDNLGRMQKVYTDCFVTGDTPVTWKKTEANIFETTLDKSSYSPGDLATLLLKSPFQSARALIAVEKPDANEYHWIDIKNGTGLFSIPVTKNMIPRLPVHTLLIRGRLPGGGTEQVRFKDDRRKPQAMANTTWIYVEPDENKALITLDHPNKTEPGEEITLTVTMTDARGVPLDGAVSLWLVDRAVLALGTEQFKNPLYSFIGDVRSHIRIRETRNDVVGNLAVEENPGGGGEFEKEIGLIERTSIRRVFQTVPYFNDTIVVRNGKASVRITLPDNLTDFAVRAIGISGPDKFGTASSRISVRLPLIVQSSLPRFVRPFDDFVAGGIGRVVEGEGGPGSYQIKTDGMYIRRDGGLFIEQSGHLVWETGRPHRLYFPFHVPEETSEPYMKEVRITLAVKRDADNASDGFSLRLPWQYDIAKNRIDRFGLLTGKKPLQFPGIGEAYRKNSVRRRFIITTEPVLLSILNGMTYLSNYAHLCTEQRISKLYPGLALFNLFNTLGLKDAYYPDTHQMSELVAYLGSCLTDDGLYSFWPGSAGYVFLTAYVVEFLSLARTAGFDFPGDLLDRPVAALKRALRSDYAFLTSGYALRERIEALLALGEIGIYEEEYAQDLLVAAYHSDLYEQGRILYYFIKNGKKSNEQAKKLLALLRERTVFSLDEKRKRVFEGLQYTNTRWGGPVLSYEMQSFASVLRALYHADPSSKDVRLMLDYLVSRSDEDGWGNTATNVAVLLALGDILSIEAKRRDNVVFTLESGGRKSDLVLKDSPLLIHEDTQADECSLTLSSSNAKTDPACFYSIEYVPAGPGDTVTAVSKGFVLSREHLRYHSDNRLAAKNAVQAGGTIRYETEDIVEEHIRLVSASDEYYVAIRVPLASGFEPLNPELKTAPKEAKPAGSFTRQPSYSVYADDHVTFYYDYLPRGTYDFYFRVRAGFEGQCIQPPATCGLMYDLSKYGRSDGTRIKIDTKKDGK
ncbi:MAG: hypothetical protein JW881_14265 [Spirochaetales bacterium]|nr:hypothetical protein [Spirochaetales bacterium]